MITYNNIVTKFEEFVANHKLVQTFSHGSPSDVDLDKFETYPLLHLVYIGGNYGENTKTYNLEIYILDLPPNATDKVAHQQSAMSNSEQVAEDILADIKNGGNIFHFGYYYEVTNANITPLEETQSNVLAGTLLSIGIEVAYGYDACNAPFDGVAPEGTLPIPYTTRGLLRVRELDGDPDVTSVVTINVPNNSLTDDGNGVITLAFGTGTGAVDSVSGGTGLTADPTTGDVVVSLNNTAVTAGDYINAAISVDQQGRITSAANGTAASPITLSAGGEIGHALSGASAGSYTNANITIDATGHITAAANGTAGGDSSRVIVTAKNVSGVTLPKGTPVHAVTPVSAGQIVEVIAARADTPSAMPATLVLNEELVDEQEGEAIVVGLIINVDTSAFTAGDVIYVGATGGYTNIKPTGTNLIQNLGVVVKSHASSGSGIVYGSGRSNDVPNLPDGKLFIGSTGNTQESPYGIPTTAPSDNDTLVYDAASSAFVAGHPISAGQQTTFVATSTQATSYATGTGLKTVEFGSYLAGKVVFTQNCRAGFNMGMNVGGNQFLAQPIGIGSTFTIELTVEANAPAGTIGTITSTATGWPSAALTTAPFFGDGTWQTLTATISAQVSFWQLANTATYYLNLLASSGTLQMRNPVWELTINHS